MKHYKTYKRKNKKTRKTHRRKYGGVNNNQFGYNSNNQLSMIGNETIIYENKRDALTNILTDIFIKFEEIISTNPNFELYENEFINFIDLFNEKAIEIDEKLGNNDMQEIIQQRVQDIRDLFISVCK
jgi:hypothetical protein